MINSAARTKRVLVVDDSTDYLNFVKLFLEAEGFQVDIAVSAQAMEAALRARTPDMVISDVRIPGHEAFAALNILRADARTREIPVLLCTAALQDVDQSADRLREERVEVLLKPFDIEVLLDHVRRLTRVREVPLV